VNIAHIRLKIYRNFRYGDLAERSTFRKWVPWHRVQAIEHRLHPGGFDIFSIANLIPADFFLEDVFNVNQFWQRDDIIIFEKSTVLRACIGLFVNQELIAQDAGKRWVQVDQSC